MKVYCKDCVWLVFNYNYIRGSLYTEEYICTCPSFIKTYDTPLERKTRYGDYKEINKHNDCKSFMSKK